MTQVIIYAQENGSVAVCYPSGEIPIEEVLAKDCPVGAKIVDSATLPSGNDNFYFDAWELNGSTISVNLVKAKNIAHGNLNSVARSEANHRMTNSSIGISNKKSDADWISILAAARSAIDAANNTNDLINAVVPVHAAIRENA